MLEFSFKGFFKGVNGFLDNWSFLFSRNKEQKGQENKNRIESDNTFKPLFIVENIPKREYKNQESEENNGKKWDCLPSDHGH
jgi:hypothetical protein